MKMCFREFERGRNRECRETETGWESERDLERDGAIRSEREGKKTRGRGR